MLLLWALAISGCGGGEATSAPDGAASEPAWTRVAPPDDLPRDRPLQVGFLILEGVYNTELTAPFDIFHHTPFHTEPEPGMRVFTISPDGLPVTSFEGLRIAADFDSYRLQRVGLVPFTGDETAFVDASHLQAAFLGELSSTVDYEIVPLDLTDLEEIPEHTVVVTERVREGVSVFEEPVFWIITGLVSLDLASCERCRVLMTHTYSPYSRPRSPIRARGSHAHRCCSALEKISDTTRVS